MCWELVLFCRASVSYAHVEKGWRLDTYRQLYYPHTLSKEELKKEHSTSLGENEMLYMNNNCFYTWKLTDNERPSMIRLRVKVNTSYGWRQKICQIIPQPIEEVCLRIVWSSEQLMFLLSIPIPLISPLTPSTLMTSDSLVYNDRRSETRKILCENSEWVWAVCVCCTFMKFISLYCSKV